MDKDKLINNMSGKLGIYRDGVLIAEIAPGETITLGSLKAADPGIPIYSTHLDPNPTKGLAVREVPDAIKVEMLSDGRTQASDEALGGKK